MSKESDALKIKYPAGIDPKHVRVIKVDKNGADRNADTPGIRSKVD